MNLQFLMTCALVSRHLEDIRFDFLVLAHCVYRISHVGSPLKKLSLNQFDSKETQTDMLTALPKAHPKLNHICFICEDHSKFALLNGEFTCREDMQAVLHIRSHSLERDSIDTPTCLAQPSKNLTDQNLYFIVSTNRNILHFASLNRHCQRLGYIHLTGICIGCSSCDGRLLCQACRRDGMSGLSVFLI